MSRNLYTIAVIGARCAQELGALEPAAGVVTVEERLRAMVAAPEPYVAFYRTLLDGWNTTHRELAAPLTRLSPALGRRLDQLDRDQTVLLDADDLAPLRDHERPTEDRSGNPGWYAMEAFWDALHHAAHFAAASRCRVVLTWRVLHASFGDGDFETP